MQAFLNKLSHSKYTRPLLLLLLALAVLILLGSLTGLLDRSEPAWTNPTLPAPTLQASPTPGWWNDLPTPLPVNDRKHPDAGEQP